MDDQMSAEIVPPLNETNTTDSIKRLIRWSLRKADPRTPDQTEQLSEGLYKRVLEYTSDRVKADRRYQADKQFDAVEKADWFNSSDAMVWAIKFSQMVKTTANGEGFDPDDVGTLVGWFASAIEVGRRAGYNQDKADVLGKNYEELKKQYERQLHDMSQKIVAQRNEIEELQRKNDRQTKTIGEYQKDADYYQSSKRSNVPLESLVAPETITPGQRLVMTPPRDAGYGKPQDPDKLDMGVKGYTGDEDCDECSYPLRQTTNLVCQKCGWDYGKGPKGVKGGTAEITIKPDSSEVFIHKMVTNDEGTVVELDITRGNGERFTYPPRPVRDNPQA